MEILQVGNFNKDNYCKVFTKDFKTYKVKDHKSGVAFKFCEKKEVISKFPSVRREVFEYINKCFLDWKRNIMAFMLINRITFKEELISEDIRGNIIQFLRPVTLYIVQYDYSVEPFYPLRRYTNVCAAK